MKREFAAELASKAGVVREIIRDADMVVEVLDARDVEGTRSKMVEYAARNFGKRFIFLINKCDLAAPQLVQKERSRLMKIAPAYSISVAKRQGVLMLKGAIKQHAKKLPVRVAIVGYPNVGKSSIINALKGAKSAGVAPVPGFTKGGQWLRVSKDIMLYDSPGVVPLREIRNETTLALKGAVEADKLDDPVAAATEILKRVLSAKPAALGRLYDIKMKSEDPEDIMRAIALRRGRILKGGEPDTDAAAKLIVRDWYNGKLKI